MGQGTDRQGEKPTFEKLEATERFRSVFDQLFDAAYIHDHQGRHLYVNRRACESLGYEREELLALNVWDIGVDVPPLEELGAIWSETSTGQVKTIETVHKRKDGSTFPVEIRLGPIEFEGETVVLAIVRDLTQRKRSEEALREAYETINRSPAVAFIWRNEEGWPVEFVSENVEDLFGYHADEFTSETILYRDVVHPEDLERVASEVMTFSEDAGRQSFCHEPYRIVRKDGAVRWVDDRTHISRNDSEEVTHFRGIVIDITEQRRAEEAVRKLEYKVLRAQKLESLGALAGGIAHDFNNLLMGILGNVSLVLENVPSEAPELPPLQDIELAAQKASELCRQMLAYSGRGQLKLERLDLTEVVLEMSHLIRATVPRTTELQLDLSQEAALIEADPVQLRQAIINLVTNASEALEGQRGVVTVSTGARHCEREDLRSAFLDEDLPDGTYVYLEVEDRGIGMDTETSTKIFDPFFSTKFAGRGLGLAAVLGIARSHRGAISVESELGVGTRVRIYLPLSDKAEDSTTKRDSDHDYMGSGTVLLVDDDALVINATRRMLKQLGFDVLTATNGREALEQFLAYEGQLAFVLLDLTMPEMGGVEAFHELLELEPKLKVIIASGYDRHDVTPRFTEALPAGFIQKPYKLGQLQKVLREMLER